MLGQCEKCLYISRLALVDNRGHPSVLLECLGRLIMKGSGHYKRSALHGRFREADRAKDQGR